MNNDLDQIAKAAEGLLFISETDHPLEPIELQGNDIEKELERLTESNEGTSVETQTLEYFFRNMVRVYPSYSGLQIQTAERFKSLQDLLQRKLKDVRVYRLGTIQIDAFIIGRLADGRYGGLRTKLVET